MPAGTRDAADEHPFVGRTRERARLRSLLDRVRDGRGGALVVVGEAGLGKTRLLLDALRDEESIRCVTVHGFESEARLGYAVLHRLLGPFLPALPALPPPQQQDLAVVFGLTSGPPPTRRAVMVAALALLTHAAADQPLLLVVDDAQWVDQETTDTLACLAGRLAGGSVGLVVALTAPAELPPAFRGVDTLRLAPLTEHDMRELLRHAAVTTAPPAVVDRLVEESHGNPLALLEHVSTLGAERISGLLPLPPGLPVVARLTATFAERLAGLPARTRELLLALAAAGQDEAPLLPDVLRGLGTGWDAAEPAVAAHLLTPGAQPVFRHPQIRSVVYERAGVASRRSVHAVLAEVAAERGLPDVAAWHRAHAVDAPDEQVAAQLDETAVRACLRGGYAAEATFRTLAAQFSIPGSPAQTARLLAAADAHHISGAAPVAERLLEQVHLRGGSEPLVEAKRVQASLLASNEHGTDVPSLLAAAEGAHDRDPALSRQLLQGALTVALAQANGPAEVKQVGRLLLERPYPPGRAPGPVDLLHDGLAVRVTEGHAAAGPLLRAALDGLGGVPELPSTSTAVLAWIAVEDLWDDRFAATTWERMTSLNRAKGAWGTVWLGVAVSGVFQARYGEIDRAEASLAEARSLASAVGVPLENVHAAEIELRAWQGRELETRTMADALVRLVAERQGFGSVVTSTHHALTTLELGLGRYSEALAHARAVAAHDPPGHSSRILPQLVEAAVRSGAQTEAETALAELERRSTTAGSAWAAGLLSRSRALVLGAAPEAEAAYLEAVRILSATPLRTESARTQLLYGEWLRRRRRRRDARDQLEPARDAFVRMGALAFAGRARSEISGLGVPREGAGSSLTSQENRVAELAAAGMTNGEIAERLSISTSTVDHHLAKAFQKLAVNSRRRLRSALQL